MKIKRIKKLKVNCYVFDVKWNPKHNGGSVEYADKIIEIGVDNGLDNEIFMVICHEIWEICAIEMHCHFTRPDIEDDYIFMYDHRQHDTMVNMFAGLISQFIE